MSILRSAAAVLAAVLPLLATSGEIANPDGSIVLPPEPTRLIVVHRPTGGQVKRSDDKAIEPVATRAQPESVLRERRTRRDRVAAEFGIVTLPLSDVVHSHSVTRLS
jgi:hypothetical protein